MSNTMEIGNLVSVQTSENKIIRYQGEGEKMPGILLFVCLFVFCHEKKWDSVSHVYTQVEIFRVLLLLKYFYNVTA